jgi:hypothetical protein
MFPQKKGKLDSLFPIQAQYNLTESGGPIYMLFVVGKATVAETFLQECRVFTVRNTATIIHTHSLIYHICVCYMSIPIDIFVKQAAYTTSMAV